MHIKQEPTMDTIMQIGENNYSQAPSSIGIVSLENITNAMPDQLLLHIDFQPITKVKDVIQMLANQDTHKKSQDATLTPK